MQTNPKMLMFIGIVLTVFGIFYSSSHLESHVQLYLGVKSQQNVYIFFGTRPEVIKVSQVIKEFSKSNKFNIVTVFTGQHPDLIKPFLNLFDITVDVWITGTFARNQSITDLIGKLLLELRNQITFNESDIWIVQGDTTTALAVALLAFHNGIRIGHIEAGLRTFNMYSPFPEEFNRKTISSISTYHFAPTENNKILLLNEGVPNNQIFVTGNTVIDAVKYLHERKKTVIPHALKNIILSDKIIVLVTIHRRENILVMSDMYQAIKSVPCTKCLFIVPVHPNPQAGIHAENICKQSPNKFICVPPLSFQEIHWVMNKSQVLLSDSGGLQEEATWYHKPTLVLRENTERTEALNAGIALLVGRDTNKLKEKLSTLINTSSELSKSMARQLYPFGSGNSSKQIHDIIVSHCCDPNRNVILEKSSTLQNPIHSKLDKKSVCVILQVFKRNTISKQLEAVFRQTLRPSTVVILQNGYYVDIAKVVYDFRKMYPNVQLMHIASSKNLRFHGRFHLAYMMKESFVSVWDDDVLPGNQWLEYCINYSLSHNNALIGANGRIFTKIKNNKMIWSECYGENDFVGHTWTLPREYLKYYITSEMFTLHTGEDIQLSFALQKIGIKSIKPPGGKDKMPGDTKEAVDKYSSWKTDQSPRQLLFCKILKYGFKTLLCSNCHQQEVLDKCIKHHENKAKLVEARMESIDKEENNIPVWTSNKHKI